MPSTDALKTTNERPLPLLRTLIQLSKRRTMVRESGKTVTWLPFMIVPWKKQLLMNATRTSPSALGRPRMDNSIWLSIGTDIFFRARSGVGTRGGDATSTEPATSIRMISRDLRKDKMGDYETWPALDRVE